ILIVASPENWLPYAELEQFKSSEFQENGDVFCPNATLEEKAIFRERSEDLKLLNKTQDLKNFQSLTVFSLNDNFFGINLKWVREFTNIYQITPIPCCPRHIVGNMNLRGEILTLVDIRPLFNLPIINISKSSKAMVVQVEDIVAGIVVEDVCDVMFFINPQEITPIDTVNNNYCEGKIFYRQGIMNILNLSQIFQNSGFIVDQVV
ncbi:chemotaxis protein CheW, partial [Aetokthonos hydrillicola]